MTNTTPQAPLRVLAINPGATSTKVGIFEGETPLLKKSVEHSTADLAKFPRVADQYTYRFELVEAALRDAGVALDSLDAVVGRGGLMNPVPGGVYEVNDAMVEDLRKAEHGEHPSNLGAPLAREFARKAGVRAFIVDPVATDEMEPVARISGLAGLDRTGFHHALNHRAVAKKVAREMGKRYEDLDLVVAHLGTGITVAAHRHGKSVDVCDARSEGPFSMDRAGGLPAYSLMNLCYSGKYTHKEMRELLIARGGMYSYLDTKDLRQVERLAQEGHEQAALLIDALAYQVAKEIGAQATVLEGHVDRIILTGGMANSALLVEKISRRVAFIAPLALVPGEEELEALSAGVQRVLRGEEKEKIYR